ncbi:PepSY-associated TM helix domain-containing protein [uncultured Bacteroides sp.]|uniref:PepSY-associated TM helix domain-containing protein n=1 Tax=uncultured Bacteroides sp. TaxID=162156 RepID=UPI002AAC16FC|nr:PepSY-associated TM helix domain-containing protein [uncultured Bacteroides sp.]
MRKVSVRTVFRALHLWLSFPAGIVIFIVAITGAIYAFGDEIEDIFRPSLKVEANGHSFLSPQELREKINQYVFKTPADSSNIIQGISYTTYDQAAKALCRIGKEGYVLYVNPYTGALIHKEAYRSGFFYFILAGHRHLWLPPAIGKPIVGWSVVIFVFLLISGLILWFPVKFTKKAFKRGLKIKWKAPFARVNYDLHNTLGFYVAIFALLIALTGLTWSFKWFSEGYYSLISGGKPFKRWEVAKSDTTQQARFKDPSTIIWEKINQEYPIGQKGVLNFQFPRGAEGAYSISYNPMNNGSYRKREYRFFDKNTLEEVKAGGVYGIKPSEASTADKLYRMSYDIHVGSIWGLPGRILACLISLIIASLPVTGTIMWWKKKKKQRSIGLKKRTSK